METMTNDCLSHLLGWSAENRETWWLIEMVMWVDHVTCRHLLASIISSALSTMNQFVTHVLLLCRGLTLHYCRRAALDCRTEGPDYHRHYRAELHWRKFFNQHEYSAWLKKIHDLVFTRQRAELPRCASWSVAHNTKKTSAGCGRWGWGWGRKSKDGNQREVVDRKSVV